jgi:hypothetical protein
MSVGQPEAQVKGLVGVISDLKVNTVKENSSATPKGLRPVSIRENVIVMTPAFHNRERCVQGHPVY